MPFPLSVGVTIQVHAEGVQAKSGQIQITVDTREVGSLTFGIRSREAGRTSIKAGSARPPKWLNFPYKVDVKPLADEVIGEINPFVYGHFIEHLERCIYDGIWDKDGDHLREDTLSLIETLKPPIVRYPGGNFASGYHWEDGIGPKHLRPVRTDEAWKAEDTNQVGTDEYMEFCRRIGTEPFLVVNDGSGTPEEAARWVAYCNEDASGEQGARRAANGHPEPYKVKIWGIGNEVWGAWQIGHTSAEAYAERLVSFAKAMRAVDPEIFLVAVGDKVLTDEPDDPGKLWNEVVLQKAGSLINAISFHLYQPDQEGWREFYDPEELHRVVCAAPLAAEAIIERIADQINQICPDRSITIAFDEWNLWLPPPEGALSMHHVVYSMRDALYCAGMLNVFQRKCRVLSIANLAQMVNVLPLIVTDADRSYATPMYFPFIMYHEMEKYSLKVIHSGKFFDSSELGNIESLRDVPWCDVSATTNEDKSRVVLGIINRHPYRHANLHLDLKSFTRVKPDKALLLYHPDPMSVNTFDQPETVKIKQVQLPDRPSARFSLDVPPCSVAIFSAVSAL